MQQQLTNAGEQAVHSMSQRYGVSVQAVRTLLQAVAAGNGTMAQFHHPEFGGSGQWMRGGMTMVGDMFNHNLAALVSNLCNELSSLLSQGNVFAPLPTSQHSVRTISIAANSWWPPELGNPSASGSQNDARYAIFPEAQRLVIFSGGQLQIYDTLDHQIGGVQQQQGGRSGTLAFTSQRGTFQVDSLPRVNRSADSMEPGASSSPPARASRSQDDVLGALERLGKLQQSGVLTKEEFEAKKAELLARI